MDGFYPALLPEKIRICPKWTFYGNLILLGDIPRLLLYLLCKCLERKSPGDYVFLGVGGGRGGLGGIPGLSILNI